MDIKLDLNKHCIETEIKRLHNRIISQYFKSNGNKAKLEERLELLQKALEELNFGKLRSTYVELAGHNNDVITLSKEENQLVIRINGIKVEL